MRTSGRTANNAVASGPGPGAAQQAAGDDAGAAVRNSDFVQSLDRGLAVIRAFGPDRERLSLSEVAQATGLTRAAARRFLLTLVKLGYARSDGREFSLRPRVLELGYAYLSGLALPEVAAPHMEELVARLHESSSISVLDGHHIVYVVRVPTKRIMTVAISVGTRFPAYATSMGRVLLAAMSEDDLDRYLAEAVLEPFTSRTVTDPGRLGRSSARWRDRATRSSIRNLRRACGRSPRRSAVPPTSATLPSMCPRMPAGSAWRHCVPKYSPNCSRRPARLRLTCRRRDRPDGRPAGAAFRPFPRARPALREAVDSR